MTASRAGVFPARSACPETSPAVAGALMPTSIKIQIVPRYLTVVPRMCTEMCPTRYSTGAVEYAIEDFRADAPAGQRRSVSTSRRGQAPQSVYRFYCAHGDRENRIKEMKNDLSAGRTSCHRFLRSEEH